MSFNHSRENLEFRSTTPPKMCRYRYPLGTDANSVGPTLPHGGIGIYTSFVVWPDLVNSGRMESLFRRWNGGFSVGMRRSCERMQNWGTCRRLDRPSLRANPAPMRRRRRPGDS